MYRRCSLSGGVPRNSATQTPRAIRCWGPESVLEMLGTFSILKFRTRSTFDPRSNCFVIPDWAMIDNENDDDRDLNVRTTRRRNMSRASSGPSRAVG